MLRLALTILAVLGLISSAFSVVIKIFGSDWAVAEYAGSSRNVDASLITIVVCLCLLALVEILDRLESIDEKLGK